MKYPKLFLVGSPRSGTHWLRRFFIDNHFVNNDYESSIYKVIYGSLVRSRFFFNRSSRTIKKNYMNSHLDKWVQESDFLNMIKPINLFTFNKKKHALLIIKSILNQYYLRNGGNGNKVLVEKTPDHIYYAEHILSHFNEARIIEIVRFGPSVVLSLRRLKEKGEKWVPKNNYDCYLLWKNAIEKGLLLKKDDRYSNRILRIKYEALVTDPKKTLKEIFIFLSLNISDPELDQIIDQNKTSKSEDQLYESKQLLTEEEQNIFKKDGNKLLAKLDYPLV